MMLFRRNELTTFQLFLRYFFFTLTPDTFIRILQTSQDTLAIGLISRNSLPCSWMLSSTLRTNSTPLFPSEGNWTGCFVKWIIQLTNYYFSSQQSDPAEKVFAALAQSTVMVSILWHAFQDLTVIFPSPLLSHPSATCLSLRISLSTWLTSTLNINSLSLTSRERPLR